MVKLLGRSVCDPMISTRPGRFLAAAAASGLIAGAVVLSSLAVASPRPARAKPHLTERRILSIAKTAAARAGDPKPLLIQHSEGTRHRANLVDSGDIVPGRQRSYLIAERGRFLFTDAPTPSGARAPTGSVLTLVVDASTGEITDTGLSNHYPDLTALGPVTTDLRR